MNSAKGWRLATAVLSVLCVALAYRVFDQGLTRTYLDASQESSGRHIKLLVSLIEQDWVGLPEAEVIARLNKFVAGQPPNTTVLKREPETGDILFDGLRLTFRDGRLAKIN